MSIPSAARNLLLAAAFGALGCGGRDAPPAAQAAPAPTVRIVSPAAGDTVALPVVVTLEATGVEVVPATGTAEPGRGHHHLIVDRDLPDPSLPIPSEPGFVHLGTGVATYTFDSLPPGPHRIISLFATGDHVPMAGVKPDTVRFVVR